MATTHTAPLTTAAAHQSITAWRDRLAAFVGGRILYSLAGYLIMLTGIRPPEAEAEAQ